MEYGTSSYGGLASTSLALEKLTLRLPCFAVTALRATKSPRPPKQCQILKTGIVGAEAIFEFYERLRLIFHYGILNVAHGGVKCIAPFRNIYTNTESALYCDYSLIEARKFTSVNVLWSN